MAEHASGGPCLLEINARTWLAHLARQAGRRLTLADIDDGVLAGIAGQGFDWVWLLGVWQTAPASRTVSRTNPAWQAGFREALPDLTDDDIGGSGFAISAYQVDDALGGPAGLAALRERLAGHGLRLMLDFVPNHTGLDHPWVRSRPDLYVEASEAALAAAPQNHLRVDTDHGPRILAHGRDPNFPGWPDTLQLNYGNPALQEAQLAELAAIARLCDGVRCDMAMLLLPQVFERSWGVAPAAFWPRATAAARQARPDFLFLAEAYWDLEWELLQQGFDFCYDKRLYDRLGDHDAAGVRAHLSADVAYQARLARFLENHDEPRAATAFSWPRHRAAAVITYFAPGLRLFQAGQLDGARVRVPVHLRRAPEETTDTAIAAFYRQLLDILTRHGAFRAGHWSLIQPRPAWDGNPTAGSFVAYAWAGAEQGNHLLVVNFSEGRGQCYLPLPFPGLAAGRHRLIDQTGAEVYEREGDALVGEGLYVDLEGWGYNLFRLTRIAP
jgi:hypothetical protein